MKIWIKTHVGGVVVSTPVEATVFGSWAVHRKSEAGSKWSRRHWSITNIAIGMCFPSFFTDDMTKATAIATAKAIDAEIGTRKITKKIGMRLGAIAHEQLLALQGVKPRTIHRVATGIERDKSGKPSRLRP